MKALNYIIFGMLCMAGATNAQNATVYFDYGKDALRRDARKTLDSLASVLPKEVITHQLRLQGHTDSDGDKAYNQALSIRRCEAVRNYLANKGFATDRIAIEGVNFEKPNADNQDDKGKALNRRVELFWSAIETPKKGNEQLTYDDFEQTSSHSSGTKSPHHYVVKVNRKPAVALDFPKHQIDFEANKGVETTYSSGTVIRIPADVLVYADGKPVTGAVQLEYYEMRDAADFIAAGFPMEVKGDNIFNSAGMFEISVTQDGKEVFVKEGGYYDIEFQKTDDLPNLGFFKYDRKTDAWTKLGRLDEDAESFNTQTDGYCYRPNNGFRITAKDTVNSFLAAMDIAMDMVKNAGLMDEYAAGRFLTFDERWASPLYSDTFFVGNKDWRNSTLLLQTSAELSKSQLEYADSSKTKVGALNNTHLNINLTNSGGRADLDLLKECEWFYLKKGHAYDLEDIKNDWRDGKKMKSSDIGNLNAKRQIGQDTSFELVDEYGYLYSQYRQWRDARLVYNGNGSFDLLLKGDKEVRMTIYPDFGTLSEKQYLKKCAALDKKYQAALDARRTAFDARMTSHRQHWDLFVDYSKPFLSRSEACMSKTEWFNYFDENHGTTMKDRYEALASISPNADSIAITLNRGTLPPRPIDPSTELGQGLRLNGFGVFNCDQITRLGNPIQLYTSYENSDGKKIDVQSLYSIDYQLNTAMTFDPNRPAINPKSETAFFLVDYQGGTHIVRAATLRAQNPQDQGSYRLVADNLTGKIRNTDDLRRELGLMPGK